MRERIVFLTGHLAVKRLEKVLSEMDDQSFDWDIVNLGVKVAALMTSAIIKRRMPDRVKKAQRVVLPGRCRADLDELSTHFGVPFERGPDELKDLPAYFGKQKRAPDLSKYAVQIFAEIVEASELSVDEIVVRAKALAASGADVIDLGCLPDTPFDHLADAVKALKAVGLKVSVDSADADELRRGGLAGADYLLSLHEDNLWLADEVSSVPILIPAQHGDLQSLYRAMDQMDKKGRPYLCDPILDPIHHGFMASLSRYEQVRKDRPDANILMGTGNLTELTDADSSGVTAMLMGLCSELDIAHVLVVQVSPHTRRTVEEHDAARRIMYAAKQDHNTPKDYSNALLCLRDKAPFVNSAKEISEFAGEVRDKNFRIETSEDGVHIYNRDFHGLSEDSFSLFPKLGVEEDGAHAFYLGAELMRAELSWRLGKRYAQDEPLDWGVAVDKSDEDLTTLREAGHTLAARARKQDQ